METDNKEKKKKLVEIEIIGTEKCLDARDENDDTILMFSRFSWDDLVFRVDENEYNVEDFEELYYEKEDLDVLGDVDAAEFFEGEIYSFKYFFRGKKASTGILYTNKASCCFNIEIDEEEEFDPQKANIVCYDFIYPDDTDESMLVAFVYDGVPYTDICPETTKEYDEEQIWPICDDDDDWCNDEVNEDDE